MTRMSKPILLLLMLFLTIPCQAIEISGSPYATEGALVPETYPSTGEKFILVDPKDHAWGAYDASGKLIRWGIATAGANICDDTGKSCRTKVGTFRLYSLGNASCFSSQYPFPGGGAPMPYCMYFNGSQAIHGSRDVSLQNGSHGCVRVNISDAKWLRFQFVQAPSKENNFRGTKVIIEDY